MKEPPREPHDPGKGLGPPRRPHLEDTMPDLATLDLDALLAGARAEVTTEPDGAIPHLVELHRRGSRDIFERAVVACAATSADERALGARILRELGGSPPRFAADAVAVLAPMLRTEPSPKVLRWVISAIGYQHAPGHLRAGLATAPAVLAATLACATHADDDVRFAVAAALPALVDLAAPEPAAIRVLLALATDPLADTRYYALAALTDDLGLVAHPDVRAALASRRAEDADAQIRTAAGRVLSGGTWAE